MSTATQPAVKRHALGMPEGSVRSILAILVVTLVCAVMLVPGRKELVPPYLLYLMFLILGHFFAAMRHHDPQQHAPLYIPRTLIKLAIIGALIATIGWKLYENPEDLKEKWMASMDLVKEQWFMPLLLIAGFFLGIILRMFVGQNPSPWAQDFEAWVALIAVIGLFIMALVHLVIAPSTDRPFGLPKFEGFLAAVIAFYFGARS
jgi:peptidoglycan/LPS O-acetylase OafA/YrhL